MSLRRLWMAAAVSGPLLLSGLARAEARFAYVDLQRALQEVDEGRNAQSRLKGMLEDKQKDLDKEQEALRKEKDLLDKQASAMSEETRVQRTTALEKKLYDLQQKWVRGQQEMKTKEQEELRSIFSKMDPIIAGIAQREGFTMVFDKSNSGLVYAPASLDLTNELVRLYNDQYHGGKGGSTPAKSSGTKKEARK